MIRARGVFSREEYCRALSDYLNLSINQILVAPNPIIRAIGMLDRRVGKRRLVEMDIRNEHALVRQFYEIRMEAEGLEVLAGS